MWFFDLEADGLLHEATQVWCGVFKNSSTGEVRKFTPDTIGEMIKWLNEKPLHLCGHNIIRFDLPLLKKLHGYEHKGDRTDTLLISKLHQPNRISPPNCPNKKAPHSLEAWGYRVGRGKPEHNDWSQFSEDMLHRCSEDVEITELTYDYLMEEGEGQNWEAAYKLTHKLFEILHKQEEYGWLVDRERLDFNLNLLRKWKNRINTVLQPHLPAICIVEESKTKGEYKWVKKPFLKSGKYSKSVITWHESIGKPIPVSGPFTRVSFRKVSLDKRVELIPYLLSLGWSPKEWNTDSNGLPTSPKLSKDDPFDGLGGSKVGRLIVKYVQCKHRESTIEGYVKSIRPDGRLPSVVSGLATTGRAKHKVVVNVPGGDSFFGKQMRKIFSCKPGYKLIGCDSAGNQNRQLAARVGDEFFTKTLVEGKKEDKTSIHFVNQRAFAERGYDVPYGMCKNLNYGTLFGASNAKLGKMIGGTPDDGEQIRQAILGVAPGFKELVENLTEEWKSNAKVRRNKWGHKEYYNGWITGLDGRPIFIEKEHTLLVYTLQSDEAIHMSVAYCFLYKWLNEKGLKWGDDWAYVNWNHDEYNIECKEELVDTIVPLAEKAIRVAGEFLNIQCPHKGEAAVGNTWWDVH